jgi:hypothetical protein
MWNNLKDSYTKSLDVYVHVPSHNYIASPLKNCIAARCSEYERVEKGLCTPLLLRRHAERRDECVEIDRLGQCGIIFS